MKRFFVTSIVLLFSLSFGFGAATAGEWHFPTGLAYISGVGDIVDQYKDNLQAQGYVTQSIDGLPVGILFQPYYEYDSGFGIGTGVGPVIMIIGDTYYLNLPVNLCLRYALTLTSDTSVYLRAGPSYNLASGDYVEDSQIGFIGAAGIELFREKRVGFGIEIGFDSSTVELEDLTTANPNDTKSYEPARFMASVFAVF